MLFVILQFSLYQVGCCTGNSIGLKHPVQISPTVIASLSDLMSEIPLYVNMI